MRTVRFAILGCGKIGSRHAAKLQEVEGAELVAVCDEIPERAEALAAQYGCKAYGSLEELLADEEVDFINVCTPSGLHAEHAIASLRGGRHVLSEKPMALTEADARRMVAVAEEAGRMLFVVKQNRYNPPVRLLLGLMEEGRLGTPLSCTVNVVWNRDEAYYASDPWRGTRDLDGGTLYTQASHFADLMLLLMGAPSSLYAMMRTNKPGIDVEDTGVIAVAFENGAVGSFNYTACASKENREGSMVFVFSNATVKVGGQYLNTIEYFHADGSDAYEIEDEGVEANDYGTYRGSMSNHHKVFADIARLWNDPEARTRLVPGSEGVDAVRFMEKAHESAREDKVVRFKP